MKKYFSVLLILLFVLLCSFQVPPVTEPFKFTWHFIVAVIVGLYELLVRLIPTVGNYSLIGKIIECLKWISDFFNLKKKK